MWPGVYSPHQANFAPVRFLEAMPAKHRTLNRSATHWNSDPEDSRDVEPGESPARKRSRIGSLSLGFGRQGRNVVRLARSTGCRGWQSIRRWGGWILSECASRWRHRSFRGFAGLGLDIHALQERVGDLENVTNATEEKFLAIGRDLQSLVRLSDRLVEETNRFTSAIGRAGGEDSALETSGSLVRDILDFARHNAERTKGFLEQVESLQDHLDQALGWQEDLVRAITPLQITQILFKIHAAGIPAEYQSGFVSLTGEMARLREQIANEFEAQFDNLAAASQTLGKILHRLKDQAAQDARLVDRESASFEEARDALGAGMVPIENCRERLDQISRQIASESGEVVIGLQYQDITRQRLEHVRAALDEMNGVFSELQCGKRSGRDHDLQFLAEAGRLQAEQLHGVVEDISRAESDLTRGIERILHPLESLSSDTEWLRQFQNTAREINDYSERLSRMLAEVRELIATIGESVEQAARGMEQCEGAASNLTSAMEQLAFRMRLIGLNAEVQAARIGVGTGLDVLSRECCNISDAIVQLSRKSSIGLETMLDRLTAVLQECTKWRQSFQDQQHELDARADLSNRRLQQCHDETVVALEQIGSILDDLRFQGRRALDSASFDGASLAPLEEMRHLMHRIYRRVQPALRRKKTDNPQHTAWNRIAGNYTMASERVLHSLVTDPAVSANPPVASSRAVALDVSSSSVNPSLPACGFPSGTASGKSAGPSRGGQNEAHATPETEPEPGAWQATSASSSSSVGESDLGDNVELF